MQFTMIQNSEKKSKFKARFANATLLRDFIWHIKLKLLYLMLLH